MFRHPAGGRKDTFHWGPADEKPVARGLKSIGPAASSMHRSPRPTISRAGWRKDRARGLRRPA